MQSRGRNADALHLPQLPVSQCLQWVLNLRDTPNATLSILCDACHTYFLQGTVIDLLCFGFVDTGQALAFFVDANGLGVLFLAGRKQTFLCHLLEEFLIGNAEGFTLFLAELSHQSVRGLTVQIDEHIIFVANAIGRDVFVGGVSVQQTALTAFQKCEELSDEFVGGTILPNILSLLFAESHQHLMELIAVHIQITSL